MALIQMLLGKKTGFCMPGALGGSDTIALELDAIITETPEYTATPTKNAVETGSDVTDHVAIDHEKVTIEGFVTDTPVNIIRTIGGIFTNDTFSNQTQQAFDFITELYQKREPFDFVGTVKVYRNMIITSLRIPRDSKTGKSLSFTMTLEQMTFVESQLFKSLKMANTVEHTGAKKSNIGQQPTQEAAIKSKERASTTLRKILKGFGV